MDIKQLWKLQELTSRYKLDDMYRIVVSPYIDEQNKFELRIHCVDTNQWILLQIPAKDTNLLVSGAKKESDNQ